MLVWSMFWVAGNATGRCVADSSFRVRILLFVLLPEAVARRCISISPDETVDPRLLHDSRKFNT